MKKFGVFFIVLFLSLAFIQNLNIQVQAQLGGIEEGLEENLEDLEDAEQKINEFKEGKWDYLGKEWQKLFLKSKFISAIDSLFSKISIVFSVLFGQAYSLSLSLFLVIVLWFYFLFKFRELVMDYLGLSSGVGILISLGGVIVFAQMKFFEHIVEFFGWIVFSQEAGWLRYTLMGGIVVFMILSYKFSSFIGDAVKAKKENLEKEQEKTDRGILRNFAGTIVEAFSN